MKFILNSGCGDKIVTKEELQQEYLGLCDEQIETCPDDWAIESWRDDYEKLTNDFDNYVWKFASDIGDSLKVYNEQGE